MVEEILGQRFFQNDEEFLIRGHLGVIGVTVERSNFKQPSTTKLTMPVCWSMLTIEKCFHGYLFVQPVVKGSKVRKCSNSTMR